MARLATEASQKPATPMGGCQRWQSHQPAPRPMPQKQKVWATMGTKVTR